MPWRGWLLVTLSVLCALPALFAGTLHDDWYHRLLGGGHWPIPHDTTFGLYDFIPGGACNAPLFALGALPWFAHPDLAVRFLRPLSSATLAFDGVWFGDSTWLAHAHSLLWFGVVLVLVWRLHRALLPERLAFWATLVFALGAAHAESTAWLSSRHMLVSGAFALGCWLSHLRWQRGWLPGALGAALLGAGLAASEAALAVVPMVLAYEGWGRQGPLRQRASRCLPLALVFLAYFGVYAAGGYGTAHTGGYVSPLRQPAAFSVAVLTRLPALVGELFTCLPSGVVHLNRTAAVLAWCLGVTSLALVALALGRRRETLAREGVNLGWLWVGALVACVPLCGTLIGGRVLLLPMVASSCAVGILLGRVPPAREGRGVVRLMGRAGFFSLFVLHLGVAPVLRVAVQLGFAKVAQAQAAMPLRARLQCGAAAPLLLVNGSDPSVGMYGGAILADHAARSGNGAALSRPFGVLTMAPNDLELERTAARRFELRVRGERRAHVLEQFFRAPSEGLRAGDQVSRSAFVATVLEATPAGPARVEFTLRVSVDQACFVRWTGGPGGHLESFDLPLHGALEVPHDPGPMGF